MTSEKPQPPVGAKPKSSRMLQEQERAVYARTLLRPDETMVEIAAIHPGIYWKSIAVAVIAAFLLLKVFNLGVLLAVVAALMFGIAWMTRHYLMLALTDKRVLIRHGIVNLDVIQMQLSRVESVELARTIMGRLLGYATVMVTGTGSRVTAIPFIANAEAFRAALDQKIYEREEQKK